MQTATAVAGPPIGAPGPLRQWALRRLRKDPRPPLAGFGFRVHESASRARIEEILLAFFTGYNAVLECSEPQQVRERCAALPEVLHPFAFEGTGMGFGARGLLDAAARPARFERHVNAVEPAWDFMYYVGLGIWTGFFGAWATHRVARRVGEPRLAGLVYDGLGFHRGFFRLPRDPRAHRGLEALGPDARSQAYRGFGRSLWFVFRDDLQGLEAAIGALPEAARPSATVGVGLAVAFTSADDWAAALARLEALPPAWQRDLVRGLRLALFVRDRGQPRALARWIAAAGSGRAALESHLAHARAAHAAAWPQPSYLDEFTGAC